MYYTFWDDDFLYDGADEDRASGVVGWVWYGTGVGNYCLLMVA